MHIITFGFFIMDVASLIKYLRIRQGLSQKDFACRLGVVRQTVSRWENGMAEPGLCDIKNMCEIFGVTLDYFFGRANSSSPDGDGKVASLSAAAEAEENEERVYEDGACREDNQGAVREECVNSVRPSEEVSRANKDIARAENSAPSPAESVCCAPDSIRKLRIFKVVFIVALALTVAAAFYTAIVGFTVFSANEGFDAQSDYRLTDFVVSALVFFIMLAASVLAFMYRSKLKAESMD